MYSYNNESAPPPVQTGTFAERLWQPPPPRPPLASNSWPNTQTGSAHPRKYQRAHFLTLFGGLRPPYRPLRRVRVRGMLPERWQTTPKPPTVTPPNGHCRFHSVDLMGDARTYHPLLGGMPLLVLILGPHDHLG